VKLDEKYRPALLSGVVGHDDIVRDLGGFVASGDIPNLVFHGPPGTGKTATARALVHEYLGSLERSVHAPLFEINASDERGIDRIRDLKESLSYRLGDGKKFIIVLLEEADGLTNDAMGAIKAMMEIPSIANRVRFIFLLNKKDHLIQPIYSRCLAYYFGPLPDEQMMVFARKIRDAEGIEIDDDVLKQVVEAVHGDARKLLTNYFEQFRVLKKVTAKHLKRFFGEREYASAIIDAMKKAPGKLEKVAIASNIYQEIRRQKDMDIQAFLVEVSRLAGPNSVPVCAEIDMRMKLGCSEPLQMVYLFTRLAEHV
jgi:DNA polymerase III delta prime subunit